MPLPDFSDEEKFLISVVKSNAGLGFNAYMWTYIIAGMLMCGFAAYHESIHLMVCAFLVILGFRLYEEWYQQKWAPKWRSIIDKYEASIMGTERPGESGHG